MKKLSRAIGNISLAAAIISGFCMTVVMLVVVANIITRRFFNTPIYGATEIARYGMMIAASFALMNNEWHDGNVTMTFIIDMFGKKCRNIVATVMNFIGFGCLCYVTYFMAMQTAYKMSTGELSSDLLLPVWVFVAVLTFGGALLALCLLAKAVLYAHAAVSGRDVEFVYNPLDGGSAENGEGDIEI